MLRRFSVVLSLIAVLLLVFEPRTLVLSSVMKDGEVASTNETADNQELQTEKKDGNRLVRVVTFPFKAIGRIFGVGGKKDDNKFHRLTEKDVKKFESSKIARVIDARSAPLAPTTTEGAAPDAASLIGKSSPTLNADQALAREYLEHGRNLINSNDFNGAVAALSRAISLDSKLYDAHNLLGIAYENKGMRALALESLAAALKGDNDQPEHLNDFGYILMKNGEYSRAVKYLKRAVKARPAEQRFLNNLGMALVQLGKFDEAYKHFEKAMGEFDGHMNIATRLVRLGYDKEAIKHLESCRAIQPTNLDVLYPLSVLYARNGRPEDAEETNKTLVSLKTSATATPQ